MERLPFLRVTLIPVREHVLLEVGFVERVVFTTHDNTTDRLLNNVRIQVVNHYLLLCSRTHETTNIAVARIRLMMLHSAWVADHSRHIGLRLWNFRSSFTRWRFLRDSAIFCSCTTKFYCRRWPRQCRRKSCRIFFYSKLLLWSCLLRIPIWRFSGSFPARHCGTTRELLERFSGHVLSALASNCAHLSACGLGCPPNNLQPERDVAKMLPGCCALPGCRGAGVPEQRRPIQNSKLFARRAVEYVIFPMIRLLLSTPSDSD